MFDDLFTCTIKQSPSNTIQRNSSFMRNKSKPARNILRKHHRSHARRVHADVQVLTPNLCNVYLQELNSGTAPIGEGQSVKER